MLLFLTKFAAERGKDAKGMNLNGESDIDY